MPLISSRALLYQLFFIYIFSIFWFWNRVIFFPSVEPDEKQLKIHNPKHSKQIQEFILVYKYFKY